MKVEYPRWVRPNRPLKGDVRYLQIASPSDPNKGTWNKQIFDGKEWRMVYGKDLERLSEKRRKLMQSMEDQRKA